MLTSHCNQWSSHLDMQWESCLEYLKCEVVIFSKFRSACVHARPLDYLDVLVLHTAHAPCTHTHVLYARCDATRFAYNANHIVIMSLSFAFHSSHVGMKWNDIIGVCIA